MLNTTALPLRPRRFVALLLLVAGLLLALAPTAFATTSSDDGATGGVVVEILPVHGYLDPPTERAILNLLASAAARESSLIVLQLSFPGVVGVDTAALAQAIEDSPVPVVVFIKPISTDRSIAGGAYRLLAAADVRAASPDALLGPYLPIEVGDRIGVDFLSEPLLAELTRTWPAAASLATDGITLFRGEQYADTTDAFDLLVPELEPLLVELDGVEVTSPDGEVTTLSLTRDEVNVRFHSLGVLGRLLHSATTPAFIYVLLIAGLGMLAFETFQPGFGVAGFAGLVTLAIAVFGLTVLPVTWWGVLLVVGAMLLYGVDTALAKLGLLTAAATAAFLVGSLFFYDSDVIRVNPWLAGTATFSAALFFVVIMTVVLRAQAGPEGLSVEQLIGRPGLVRSVLNPEGHVYVDGALWRARWTDTDGPKRLKVGKPVRVHGVDGAVLLVESFDPEGDEIAPPPMSKGIAPETADADINTDTDTETDTNTNTDAGADA
jgi:membrane-bound serine protease (ClpP class)